jgi:hypothetical protein
MSLREREISSPDYILDFLNILLYIHLINQEYSYTKIVDDIKNNYVTIKICSLNNMEIR